MNRKMGKESEEKGKKETALDSNSELNSRKEKLSFL